MNDALESRDRVSEAGPPDGFYDRYQPDEFGCMDCGLTWNEGFKRFCPFCGSLDICMNREGP